jgi:PIN domain nuclease of toxin-antitoxin system
VNLLLDTHIVLWQAGGDWAVPARVRVALDSASEINVSVVSFAEIGIKIAIGKLHAPLDLVERIRRTRVRMLGLSPEHGLGIANLPLHHRDPFDRLLISQARHESLTILTADRRFTAYDVPVVLA